MHRGSDPDVLHGILNDIFTPHVQDIVGRAGLDASVRVVEGNRLKAVDLRYGTDVVIRPAIPPDSYVVRVGHLGRAALTIDGSDSRFSPSIVSPGQVVTARWQADVHARLLVVPRAPVEDAVRAATGEDLRLPVRFTPQVEGPQALRWLAMVRMYVDMLGSGLLGQSPLAVSHFENALIHSVLAGQPSTVSDAYTGGGSAGPATLRRAVAFCQEHARRAISVADIAASARVSVRTLQELFRRHLDTTPLGYLRAVRLAGAHDDLVAVAQGRHEATVTQIANRWGLPHRGRFVALYRRTYGRYPSDTAAGDTRSPRGPVPRAEQSASARPHGT